MISVTEAGSTSPAARAYGQILLAEARSRRGDASGAASRMAELGFIDRWLFVGLFDDQNRVGFAAPYQPESELTQTIVPGRVRGKGDRAGGLSRVGERRLVRLATGCAHATRSAATSRR